MKTDFKSLRVDPDDINTIYRFYCGFKSEPSCSNQIESYFEDIVVKKLPYDEEVYMVPAILRDVLGKEVRGFGIYGSLFQTISYGGFIINKDGSLADVNKSKLLNTKKNIVTELLIEPEGVDVRVKALGAKMPDKVEWGDFYAEEAHQNVGYIFKLVGTTPLDMDLGAIKMQKELMGEIDYEDDMECTGAYLPTYILHKVFLASLPKVDHLFYLPVEIYFNEKQQRKGYAFFDGQRQQVLDVHFYDRKNDQVSAMFTSPVLEDCGLFKDEKLFNYKILLSNC